MGTAASAKKSFQFYASSGCDAHRDNFCNSKSDCYQAKQEVILIIPTKRISKTSKHFTTLSKNLYSQFQSNICTQLITETISVFTQ